MTYCSPPERRWEQSPSGRVFASTPTNSFSGKDLKTWALLSWIRTVQRPRTSRARSLAVALFGVLFGKLSAAFNVRILKSLPHPQQPISHAGSAVAAATEPRKLGSPTGPTPCRQRTRARPVASSHVLKTSNPPRKPTPRRGQRYRPVQNLS
jgi:hypothetical protein